MTDYSHTPTDVLKRMRGHAARERERWERAAEEHEAQAVNARRWALGEADEMLEIDAELGRRSA